MDTTLDVILVLAVITKLIPIAALLCWTFRKDERTKRLRRCQAFIDAVLRPKS